MAFTYRRQTKIQIGDLVQVDDATNLHNGRKGIVSGFGPNAVAVRLINSHAQTSVAIHPMHCKIMETRA
jgi:ribosomal protein L21E